MILLRLIAFMFWLQKELTTIADMAIKLYCENIPQETGRSPAKMQELIENAMKQVRKEHYLTFCKHLPICDLFGIKIL
jgi:hypothetical protein